MAWYNDTDALMKLVERAGAEQALLPNHLAGVLPKLIIKQAQNEELIRAFSVQGDVAEVKALEAEQRRIATGIGFYQSARGQVDGHGADG